MNFAKLDPPALKKRARNAAAAYIERIGGEYIKVLSPSSIRFLWANSWVYCKIHVKNLQEELPGQEGFKYAKPRSPFPYSRHDLVEISIIAEDRALLRHTRGVEFKK